MDKLTNPTLLRTEEASSRRTNENHVGFRAAKTQFHREVQMVQKAADNAVQVARDFKKAALQASTLVVKFRRDADNSRLRPASTLVVA